MAEFHAYTDRDQPGSLYVFEEPNPDLDARPNFERVNVDQVPASTLDAMRRARAERESVEAAALNRAQRAEATAGEQIRAAYHGNTGVGSSPEPAGMSLATPAHYAPSPGAQPPTGVLSRPGVDAVQIGPNPEIHNGGDREALLAQAARDAEQPNNVGVLSKPSLTTAGGNSQIGDRPEQHPTTRAGLLEAAAAGADGAPITAAGKALAGEDVDPDDQGAGDVDDQDADVEVTDGDGDVDDQDADVEVTDGDGETVEQADTSGPVVDEPEAAKPAKRTARKAAAK